MEPDIKRFWNLLKEEADPELHWEYGNGDDICPDAQAFIDGVKAMAEEILREHHERCKCELCKFARKILK